MGVTCSRHLSPQGKKSKALEEELQQSEHKLNEYQQEVTEHFAETAKLVNNLTQNYRDVHQHLANSALKLANVDISRELLSTNPSTETAAESLPIDDTISEADFQPPKDWAPRSSDAEGTLSESYGLNDSDDLSVNTVRPS